MLRLLFALSVLGLFTSTTKLNALKQNDATSAKGKIGSGYTCDINSGCDGTNLSCGYSSLDNYCTRRYFYQATSCRYSYNPFATCPGSVPNRLCYEEWTWWNSTVCGSLSAAQYTPHRINACS